MARFSNEVLRSTVDVPCPECEYPVQIQLVDVVTQVHRRCPCCRVLIKLQDGGASMYGAMEDIDAALDGLFHGFGGTWEIGL